ncbi:response regulator [Agriterribacter sp.]|uniref:response regulator n=1 Tax=Agriterribacter sp. TaxID=2821509 RepID=UPI002CB1240D|nr:response regulator [Agriterribacter sp.]HRO48121.1 response regulator [Agriterribacter sp.]HRQ19121.1 response regulator [Agriterribacter sp.]
MKKIVVTDDDPGIRDIFKMIFETAGYQVQVISNGDDLLNNAYNLPDLFLLDKQLSGVDGTDICRYLKQQRTTAHIPVIMISANPQIGKLSEEAGADAYIEKPFEVKYLLEMVKRYI